MYKNILITLLIILSILLVDREYDYKNMFNSLDTEMNEQKNKMNAAVELDTLLHQPENQPKEFLQHPYVVDKQTIIIVEPADCLHNKELEPITKLPFNPVAPNQLYWLPSKDFVKHKLIPMYKTSLAANQITYSDKFTCEDFSRFFCVFAQQIYIKLVVNKNEPGIAISEIYYLPDDNLYNFLKFGNQVRKMVEYHAINMIILDDLSIMYIEPQNGQEETLTENEKKSIIFCKF
jgi:hypothetical protein